MKEKQKNNIIIYKTEDGKTDITVRLENEDVWLSQQQMAELYQTSRTNVVEHIKHIFEEGELAEEATCRKFRQVQREGGRNNMVKAYFADAGKVSHKQATEKAGKEYLQYQVKTLSPVEKAYLDTIKGVQKKIEKKAKDENNHD